jgi:hypothetical protein
MSKHIIVFTTLLTVLFFVVGCSEVSPEPVEMPKVEPPEAKSPKVEAAESELPKAELPTTEPNLPEPNMVEAIPTASFHDKCANILKNHVDNRGMVDYKTLGRKKLELRGLLDEFNSLDPNVYNSWPKEDKIAFWINAYNIQMLRIIADNYPIESTRFHRLIWPPTSIRHIPPRSEIGASKWNGYKFLVIGEQFTLAEIEERFFRKEFEEPRVFFAISQASYSGPPLRNEPYYGYKLYEQLDDQAERFLSSPRAFKIDREERVVYLSAIFQPTWYGNEFIHKYGTDKRFKDHPLSVRAVLNFITNYIPAHDASFLEVGSYTVEYIKYDWRLNE